jgi:hypothetical protein
MEPNDSLKFTEGDKTIFIIILYYLLYFIYIIKYYKRELNKPNPISAGPKKIIMTK